MKRSETIALFNCMLSLRPREVFLETSDFHFSSIFLNASLQQSALVQEWPDGKYDNTCLEPMLTQSCGANMQLLASKG